MKTSIHDFNNGEIIKIGENCNILHNRPCVRSNQVPIHFKGFQLGNRGCGLVTECLSSMYEGSPGCGKEGSGDATYRIPWNWAVKGLLKSTTEGKEKNLTNFWKLHTTFFKQPIDASYWFEHCSCRISKLMVHYACVFICPRIFSNFQIGMYQQFWNSARTMFKSIICLILH